MKFIVNLWLDGYETEEEMEKACIEFIEESLDFSASSVSVERYVEKDNPTPRTPSCTCNAYQLENYGCQCQASKP